MEPYVNRKALFILGLLFGPFAFFISGFIWVMANIMAIVAAEKYDRPIEELLATRRGISIMARTLSFGGLITTVLLAIIIAFQK